MRTVPNNSMNELLFSIAEDFSSYFYERFELRIPIDGFLGVLATVLGNSPTKEDVLQALEKQIPQLTEEIGSWLERQITQKDVREALTIAIVNNFGANAIK